MAPPLILQQSQHVCGIRPEPRKVIQSLHSHFFTGSDAFFSNSARASCSFISRTLASTTSRKMAPLAILLNGFPCSFAGISRHVCLSGYILFLVFLHLERLDTVCKLDELDATLEAGLCRVCLDFWHQVVVRSSASAEPNVFKSSLVLLVNCNRRELLHRTSLVGRLFGSGSSSFLMNSLASGLTSFQGSLTGTASIHTEVCM